MSTKHFSINVKNFNSRLLIIPFLILMILTMSFTLFVDYVFSQMRSYCSNLFSELSSGDFSIMDEEGGSLAILFCGLWTQQNNAKWIPEAQN